MGPRQATLKFLKLAMRARECRGSGPMSEKVLRDHDDSGGPSMAHISLPVCC